MAVTTVWVREHWRTGLLAIWGCGVAWGLALGVSRHVRFVRGIGRRDSDPEWSREWQAELREAGVARDIPLRLVASTGPVLCLLPSGLQVLVPRETWQQFTSAQRRAVLRHELAHYLRGDLWKSLAARVVVLLHWFNPCAWWALRRFESCGEWACDDFATRQTSPCDLASALIELGRTRPQMAPLSSPVVGGPLFVRIRRLLTVDRSRDGTAKRGVVLTLVVLLLGVGSIRIRTSAADDIVAAENNTPPSVAKPVGNQAERGVDRLEDPLSPDAAQRLGSSRLRHGDGIVGVVFSPDGKSFATAAWDNNVKLWNLADGKLIRQFTCREASGALCAAFSADGRRLAAGCGLGMAYVFDIQSGQQLVQVRQAEPHAERLHGVALSPDGKTLASVGTDAYVYAWDVESGKKIYRYNISGRHSSDAESVAFSPDGSRIAVSRSCEMAILDWRQQKVAAAWHLPGDFISVSLAYTPDGKSIVSSGYFNSKPGPLIRIWDAETGKQIRAIESPAIAKLHHGATALSRDGKTLVTAHYGKMFVWDFEAGKVLREFDVPDFYGMRSQTVAVSPSGSVLATIGGFENRIHVLKTSDGSRLLDFDRGHANYVQHLTWSGDGHQIISVSEKQPLIWDVASGTPTLVSHRGSNYLSRVELTPDGKTMFLGGQLLDSYVSKPTDLFGRVRFVDLASNQLTGEIVVENYVTAVTCSPDGKTLAVGAGLPGIPNRYESEKPRMPQLSLWDVATRQKLGDLPGHTNKIVSLRFSVDGKMLASASEDGSVRRWDVAQKRLANAKIFKCLRRDYKTNQDTPQHLQIYSAAFTSDLETVLVTSADAPYLLIRKLSNDAGELKVERRHPQDSTPLVAISPDGRIAALTDRAYQEQQSSLRLIDIATGATLREFQGDDRSFMSVSFSRDGKRVACGTSLGTILIYDVPERLLQK